MPPVISVQNVPNLNLSDIVNLRYFVSSSSLPGIIYIYILNRMEKDGRAVAEFQVTPAMFVRLHPLDLIANRPCENRLVLALNTFQPPKSC